MTHPSASCPDSFPILLIEDEVDQMVLLSHLIPHPVRQAQSLAQGLDLLRQEVFACCVLDLGLPDSRGLATLQALRQADPNLPILVLSGDETLATATHAMDLGAWDYMVKVTSPPELVARKVAHLLAALKDQRDAKAKGDELKAIVDSAVDGIITADEYGTIRSFNPSAEAMFGWAAHEIIGQNVSCLMPAERASRHDDYLALYRSHGPSLTQGKALELVGQRKDGTPFPLRLAISEVVINGQILLTAIISDLSALKQAQNMAERLRERLGESIEALSDGFALFGPNDRLVVCNAAFRALFAEDDYLPEGTSFEDIMRAALKRGALPDALGREKQWLAQHLQSHRAGGVQEIRVDSRWVRVADRRLPDGCCVGVYTDVTLLKQSEERLRLSQGYANIGTWDWNIQTGDLFWSERIAPLFGYKVGELETSYDNFLAAIHPEDRDTVTHAVTACIERGERYDLEHRVVWPDGTVRWLLERGDVVRDHTGAPLHMLGVVQDITDLKHHQAALEISNFNLNERIKEATCLREIFEYTQEIGLADSQLLQSCAEQLPAGFLMPDETVARIRFHGRDHASPHFRESEWALREIIPFFEQEKAVVEVFRLSPANPNDPCFPDPFLKEEEILLHDVAWQIGQSLKRRADAQALTEAKQEAEKANKAKSEFLSSMSHELRTPLNAILGFAQLLEYSKKNPLTENQKKQAHYIRKGGEHLLALINEILDLSRIEAGKLALSLEPLDTRSLIDDCLLTTQSLADPKGITVVDETVPHPTAPHPTAHSTALPWIKADLTRSKQVLLNLLSNAVKYNRPNGTVRVHTQRGNTHRLRLCVSDTGFGIPADRLAELFQPFSRLGQEEGEIEGTGIGLTITRKLVEEMGGEMGVASTEGEGSTFWAEFPLAAVAPSLDDVESEAESPQPLPLTGAEGPERHVLYVEDNPANRDFMDDAFDLMEGYRLTMAPTAEQGLELAYAQRPDVVLMDINLPGMDGFAALEALRTDPRTAHIPVIALSANAMPATLQRGREAGFFAYLTKPVDLRVLAETLDASLAASLKGGPQ